MPFEHRHEALTIDRIASLDDHVEDEATAPRSQIDFVSVLNVARTLYDDVGMRLEQAHALLARGDLLTAEHPPLSLRNHLQNKCFVVRYLR